MGKMVIDLDKAKINFFFTFLFIFSLKEKTTPPDAGLQTFHKTKLLDDFRVTSKFFGGQVKATLKINFKIGVL